MKERQTIRALRLAAGMTQRALADRLGIATMSVSHWENGRNAPSAHQLIALGTVFGIPVEQINFDRDAARAEREREMETVR